MKVRNRRILKGALLILWALQPVDRYAEAASIKEDRITAAAPASWGVSAAVTFASGDYGTGATTDTLYMPVTLWRYVSGGAWSLTVPYISREAGESMSVIRGRPSRSSSVTRVTIRSDESGLGDIIFKGGYYLLREEEKGIATTLTGAVKFPTADEARGLGTGEFDYTIGLENGKRLNDAWALYGDCYYTFIGEPAGENWDNEFAFDLGIGYYLDEFTQVQLFYEQRSALVGGESLPRALSTGITYAPEQAPEFFASCSLGLTNASPAAVLTVGLHAAF